MRNKIEYMKIYCQIRQGMKFGRGFILLPDEPDFDSPVLCPVLVAGIGD
jgi:hypothetical protein